jgi:hypothetical protein
MAALALDNGLYMFSFMIGGRSYFAMIYNAGVMCCAQQTGVHRMVGSNCLIAIYLEGKDAYMYIRPTLKPEAALPPGACPAEPSAISVQCTAEPIGTSETRPTHNIMLLVDFNLAMRYFEK